MTQHTTWWWKQFEGTSETVQSNIIYNQVTCTNVTLKGSIVIVHVLGPLDCGETWASFSWPFSSLHCKIVSHCRDYISSCMCIQANFTTCWFYLCPWNFIFSVYFLIVQRGHRWYLYDTKKMTQLMSPCIVVYFLPLIFIELWRNRSDYWLQSTMWSGCKSRVEFKYETFKWVILI